MALFNGASTFYVDPSVVANSTTVDIAAIGMYFMYRPSANNNRSGTNFPGISMYLTDVVNGVPNLANTDIFKHQARAEWASITTSSDASAETRFVFPHPITVTTGAEYAFCWSYDNGEDFLPWTDHKGYYLVGTTTPSPGPSHPYGGSYFLFSSVVNGNTIPTAQGNYLTAWTPVIDTDLKFDVYAARYAINGIPVTNVSSLPLDEQIFVSDLIYSYDANTQLVSVTKPSPRVENITFNQASSIKQAYVGPQRVYQNTVFWPGGGVYATVISNQSNTLTANASLSNGAAFSWLDIFGSYAGDKYVVIQDTNEVDIRQVVTIVSNTTLVLSEATTISNNAAKIMISPVATIDSFNTSIYNGHKTAMVFLRDSSANDSVRFVGDSIDFSNVVIANSGVGYSNSDVLYVTGYEYIANVSTNKYPAVANVVTNGNGSITSLLWSNAGCGFVNTAQTTIVMSSNVRVVNNQSTNTSSGSNLALTFSYGTTLRTEHTNNVFRSSRPVNLDVHQATPIMDLDHPSGTTISTQIHTIYYQVPNANTVSGFATLVGNTQSFTFTLNKGVKLNTQQNIPVIASRSNEYGFHYANGVLNDQVSALVPYSNNYQVVLQTKSLNDYVAMGPFGSPMIEFSRYIYNNSYTNEHTDQGNALARHITSVINFSGVTGQKRMSEDLRVYVSAWRPPNSDIQVYARIKSSIDTQAFDDGDWTRLTIVSGNNFSTSGYVDLTYGFQGQPNSTLTIAGTAAATNGSYSIVGTNTTFSTQLSNGTLIKLYDPLFANNNFAVLLVTGVTDNTHITVDQFLSTNTQTGVGGLSVVGRGSMLIDVLGYGHQGFNNIQGSNVVRYYNASEHIYDGYDTLQIKAILLSSDAHSIPRLHNIRGIGCSA